MKTINKTLFTNLRYYTTHRCYYTNRVNKESLYTKISPLGDPNLDLTPELDNWIQKGNKLRFAELQRIILDFRRRKRYSQALQVSEWMNTRHVCVFTPTEHAIHLDLIGKVHGFLNAERYFMSLNEQDKIDKTYGALLHCYVRQRQTDKALSHLQKMKELGVALSPLAYNDIMSLYSSAGQHEKTYEVLTDMKKDGITPDIFSYKICINSYGVVSNYEGMERILKEMESHPHIVMDWIAYATVGNHFITAGRKDKANIALHKAEAFLDSKNGIGHNHLITLHARLGNTSDVFRMWDLMKSACKRCINKDYIVMLDTLSKLGLYDKARGMLEKLVDKQRTTTPASWERVAVGFVENDEMEKALYCFKAAISLHTESKRWKPNHKSITILMNSLGEKGSAEDVESFVASLGNVVPVDRQMYHALMKAYIRDGKEVDGILNRMKADGIPENEETKKIKNMEQVNS
ncbi:Pentatricopeptide repeat-containing protein [Heracleum sosnowskyi]|uniref:Pentatricopeptide repeat-containing protein n=1 Tax=Heracleum sosnowskyi TaxID=360622 RepID=A0AAD8I435_9APIA|nr:Pentatricopeptide repeat-containing protein [Heracleum sosnowskyi]